MSEYELIFTEANGKRLKTVNEWRKLVWTRVINDIGGLQLTVSAADFDLDLFETDRKVEVWRKPTDGRLRHVRSYFLLARQHVDYDTYTFYGSCVNDLLRRRVIAAYELSAEADKSGNADDLMKEYVDEQLGSSAATARDISDYLSIAPDLSDGASVDMEASYKGLLDVLQTLAEASRDAGTNVYFDIVEPAAGEYEFRTYTGQLGQDRTGDRIFSLERGTLEGGVEYLRDWRRAVNYMYVFGPGVAGLQEIKEVSDSDRYGRSIFGRVEATADGRRFEDPDALEDFGRQALREARPVRRLTAQITDGPQSRYQLDWDFGDKITAGYHMEEFNAHIINVTCTVENGVESLTARIEADE